MCSPTVHLVKCVFQWQLLSFYTWNLLWLLLWLVIGIFRTFCTNKQILSRNLHPAREDMPDDSSYYAWSEIADISRQGSSIRLNHAKWIGPSETTPEIGVLSSKDRSRDEHFASIHYFSTAAWPTYHRTGWNTEAEARHGSSPSEGKVLNAIPGYLATKPNRNIALSRTFF